MDSKWSQHKIENFLGAQDFFGPLNGTSDSEGHFGAKYGEEIFTTSLQGEEILKSTLFRKVCYVLNSGIIIINTNIWLFDHLSSCNSLKDLTQKPLSLSLDW